MATPFILFLILISTEICAVSAFECFGRRFDRQTANSFLKKPITDCCAEASCDELQSPCRTKEFQNHIIKTKGFACPSDQIAKVTFFCNSFKCKDPCEEEPNCQNGGTCIPQKLPKASYRCDCRPGYTGSKCETDINECDSSPCQNGATCNNLENMFKCECPDRFYGVLCDTNICHPTPADVVFVLDSSVSMTETQFRKQLDFIATFIDHVTIGPQDFQISVVTYSFDAHIEFYLDKYTDNVTLKDAVKKIAFKPGATFTDKGLEKADEVFFNGTGTARRPNNTIADRFIFLLTDGMSTDRERTAQAARRIQGKYKGYGLKMSAIGIGHEVSHRELLEIASDPSLVYSVQDFDSLYTVLKSLVHYTCDECRSSGASDVALLVDTSYRDYSDQAQSQETLDALSYIIDLMNLTDNGTDVSLTSYDVKFTERIGFLNHSDKNQIHREINMIDNDETRGEVVDIVDVMRYIESNAFSEARLDSKKIAIIFSNGNFENHVSSEMDGIKRKILKNNITTICVGSGSDVNLEGLSKLVTDTFDVYLANKKTGFKNLDVLKSYLSYNTCDLQGE